MNHLMVWSATGPSVMADVHLKLPPDKYYVLGDNRSNSLDSRAMGPISNLQIEGVVKGIAKLDEKVLDPTRPFAARFSGKNERWSSALVI